MEEKEWYYVYDGKSIGPLSKSEIGEIFMNKRLDPLTFVWSESNEYWRPAYRVEELNINFELIPRPYSRPKISFLKGIISIIQGHLEGPLEGLNTYVYWWITIPFITISLAIHIMIINKAFNHSGIIGAVITAILPFVSELYWLVSFRVNNPNIFSFYIVVMKIWIIMFSFCFAVYSVLHFLNIKAKRPFSTRR